MGFVAAPLQTATNRHSGTWLSAPAREPRPPWGAVTAPAGPPWGLMVLTSRFSPRVRAGAEHRGQLLDDGNERRLPADGGPGHLEVGEDAQQLFEQHPGLHPRQVSAQAHVRAETERHVRPGLVALDVEAVRVGPDVLVAVRAAVQQRDVVAGGDPLPADLGAGRG